MITKIRIWMSSQTPFCRMNVEEVYCLWDLMCRKVHPGSWAENQGLMVGVDELVSINGIAISSIPYLKCFKT